MAINELIEGYVSRQEAIAKGLKFYFTGKPCKRGHVAERHTNNYICIRCEKVYRIDNKEAIAGYYKVYYADNKEVISEQKRIYRADNKETIAGYHKVYYADNKETFVERGKAYYEDNKETILERVKTYRKQRKHTDIQFWLAENLRSRLCKALKGNYKSGSAVRDLGCSVEFLKQHLEQQFKVGMTWANRGKVWHIDHIEPLCSFDLEDREQLLIACHYTNLQPLFVVDNLKKISNDKKKSLNRVDENYSCITALDLVEE